MKLSNFEECISHLKSLNFEFVTHRHEPVFNMIDMNSKVPI